MHVDVQHARVAWNIVSRVVKEGTTKKQVDSSTSYPVVKTILKAKQHSKWRHEHPRYNEADPYYPLTGLEQVTVFRPRTGHNRLNYHLYSKLRIGLSGSALAVLVVRQQNIYCSPAPTTSHSERESGQDKLLKNDKNDLEIWEMATIFGKWLRYMLHVLSI